MRITGGSARGQIIKTLPGLLVRPTTDKVREAIFSMLTAMSTGWERGLDLFSGSGALGLEALSRGMGWVDFVDQNNRCCQVIKQNLTKTGFIDRAHVYCCPVMKAISFLETGYDLVFLDPPYADTCLGDLLTQLSKSRLVSSETLVTTSHAARSALEARYDDMLKIKEKRYGDTCISIYQKEATS
ncbi:MAG: 16S rRNA (guanine(966)-N(2))-methyltransferase RsmD [Dehalococcoidia bacterium]|jgi:16S rRNA G966 N2-methylase RsmD